MLSIGQRVPMSSIQTQTEAEAELEIRVGFTGTRMKEYRKRRFAPWDSKEGEVVDSYLEDPFQCK